jgi:outer membrane protein assembly factor BamD
LIAKSELVAADYYMKRKAYVAALRRANYVIENIPNTSETIRALKVVRDCYRELGYFKLMDDIQKIIDANDISPEVEPQDTSWNFFQRKAPAPSQS